MQPADQRVRADSEPLREYEPPRVTTYRGDELLERLGPAQAQTCTPGTGGDVDKTGF